MKYLRLGVIVFIAVILLSGKTFSQVQKIRVAPGWAANSVNTVIFRKNSLSSFRDTQFIAFYNATSHVVLGKRSLRDSIWILQETALTGNTADAHRSISIICDGAGFLHISWNHHGNKLHYTRSIGPGSLSLEPEQSMTGKLEENVTYPEFYRRPDGNLFFLYRDGSSGKGNLVINSYDIKTRQWTQLHANLIDGEGHRNAYWQACIDTKGTLHISWVWRENPDVRSNHDLCYAKSDDGGRTWSRSDGSKYQLPIRRETAQTVEYIPENSDLINQTSMTTDTNGYPYIAGYWHEPNSDIPQYHVVFYDGSKWHCQDMGFRTRSFQLGGTGSQHLPLSRPQIIAWDHSGKTGVAVIFRDEERGNRASIAINRNSRKNNWDIIELDNADLGGWEPSFDTDRWRSSQVLDLFFQKTEQLDEEAVSQLPAQMVYVLEWQPLTGKNKQ